MPIQYTYKICRHCVDGYVSGHDPEYLPEPPDEINHVHTQVMCPVCKGTGKVLWGYLLDELEGEE